MADSEKKHFIVLVENYWEGFWQSIVWLAVLTASIGLAVYLQSQAMQWVIGILWFIAMMGWAMEQSNKKRLTIEDAEKRIAEIKSEMNR